MEFCAAYAAAQAGLAALFGRTATLIEEHRRFRAALLAELRRAMAG